MAGTDRGLTPVQGGPHIILVDPQMGENIGAAARAMYNFGLTNMSIVRPRDGWPNSRAIANASGAHEVLERAQVYDTVEEATADFHLIFAATARDRDMVKEVATPKEAAKRIRQSIPAGHRCCILFGGERAGLSNDDVVLAQTIITVPANPAFSSLNLAQCVLLVAYEWFQFADQTPSTVITDGHTRPANGAELNGLFGHLETELDRSGFFRPSEKKPNMVRNLRNMLQRANFTEQDVRTLRGVVASLTRKSVQSPK